MRGHHRAPTGRPPGKPAGSGGDVQAAGEAGRPAGGAGLARRRRGPREGATGAGVGTEGAARRQHHRGRCEQGDATAAGPGARAATDRLGLGTARTRAGRRRARAGRPPRTCAGPRPRDDRQVGGAMLKVHHLNNSRSQRILWLLEELGTPYEIVKYQRMSPMPLAPPELKEVHPLGKSPVITDGDKTIAESGAIVEYIIDKYGNGRLRPKPGSDDYWKYVEWMHYAEGSAMLPLLLALYAGLLGDAADLLRPRIDGEIANNLSYMEAGRDGRNFFVGSDLTGADIQLLFVVEAGGSRPEPYPALVAYRDRMHVRPAYQRGIEKGGPYQLMSREPFTSSVAGGRPAGAAAGRRL